MHSLNVEFYRRRLPHLCVLNQPLFLTFRLHGSLPPNRYFPGGGIPSGRAFAALDRLLDDARTGPRHLCEPEVAAIVVAAIEFNERVLAQYECHAFVVMPNHAHMLLTPAVDVPKLMKSLKSITARRANGLLGLTGHPFWQEESYDHLVRSGDEFRRIQRYIELNPVRAGLVAEAVAYRWSSAARGADPWSAAGP